MTAERFTAGPGPTAVQVARAQAARERGRVQREAEEAQETERVAKVLGMTVDELHEARASAKAINASEFARLALFRAEKAARLNDAHAHDRHYGRL